MDELRNLQFAPQHMSPTLHEHPGGNEVEEGLGEGVLVGVGEVVEEGVIVELGGRVGDGVGEGVEVGAGVGAEGGRMHFAPLKPALHEHKPAEEHVPCPEHVVAASQSKRY